MRTVARVVHPVALPVLLVVLWWVLSADSSSIFFPPLEEILQQFREDWLFDKARSDLQPTVIRFVVGLGLAIVFGVLLGILFGLSQRARRDMSPITEFLRGTPIAALVPVGLILLGPGSTMEITLIAFACLWPVMLSTADGIRGTEPLYMETARVYGVSRRKQVFDIALRAAMPQIFSGIRIAVAFGIAVAVIANMFASSEGLGFFVIDAQSRFDIPATWSGVIVIGLIGMLANVIFVAIERRALRWHRGWRASADVAGT